YSSEDVTVATVSGSGASATITGVSSGAALIDVNFGDGVVQQVTAYVLGMTTLSPDPLLLVPNASATLTATTDPDGAAQYLTYTSENPAIATVSGTGANATVTGISAGTTQIDVYFGQTLVASTPAYVLASASLAPSPIVVP